MLGHVVALERRAVLTYKVFGRAGPRRQPYLVRVRVRARARAKVRVRVRVRVRVGVGVRAGARVRGSRTSPSAMPLCMLPSGRSLALRRKSGQW